MKGYEMKLQKNNGRGEFQHVIHNVEERRATKWLWGHLLLKRYTFAGPKRPTECLAR